MRQQTTLYRTGYDCLLSEARAYFVRMIPRDASVPRLDMIRILSRNMEIGWDTAERVLDDLYRQGILTAHYGHFRLADETMLGRELPK